MSLQLGKETYTRQGYRVVEVGLQSDSIKLMLDDPKTFLADMISEGRDDILGINPTDEVRDGYRIFKVIVRDPGGALEDFLARHWSHQVAGGFASNLPGLRGRDVEADVFVVECLPCEKQVVIKREDIFDGEVGGLKPRAEEEADAKDNSLPETKGGGVEDTSTRTQEGS